jgi:hypothetical protein
LFVVYGLLLKIAEAISGNLRFQSANPEASGAGKRTLGKRKLALFVVCGFRRRHIDKSFFSL